jgi:hypothetical protein
MNNRSILQALPRELRQQPPARGLPPPTRGSKNEPMLKEPLHQAWTVRAAGDLSGVPPALREQVIDDTAAGGDDEGSRSCRSES